MKLRSKAPKRPKQLFFRLWSGLYVVFALFEMTHSSFGWITPGTIFLAQLIALSITVIAVLAKPKWRKSSPAWMVASIAALILILFSVFQYEKGFVGDIGPKSEIVYGCILGEDDGSVIALAGEDYRQQGLTTKLCVLKNLPEAGSIAISPYGSAGWASIGVFLIYEAILFAAFMEAKRVNNLRVEL